MPQLAVTIVGTDQRGIVAAVTRVLHERGGNLEDSAMTLIGGHFAVVLLVETDDDPTALRDALVVGTEGLGLSVSVSRVEGDGMTTDPTHLLSVYGTDRPGIVAGVTTCLAEVGANITNLETTIVGEDDEPVYAMAIELVVADGGRLRQELSRVCGDLGVDHTLRTIDAQTE